MGGFQHVVLVLLTVALYEGFLFELSLLWVAFERVSLFQLLQYAPKVPVAQITCRNVYSI